MITHKIAAGALTGALAAGLAVTPVVADDDRRGGWQAAEGGTALMLTKGVKQDLREAGITVAAVEGARQWNPVLFVFPLVSTTGTTLTHDGGLVLTKGAETLTLSDFVVDTTDGTVDAVVDGSVMENVFTLTKVRKAGKWVKANVTVTTGHADMLDAAIGSDVFSDGMFVGKTATWWAGSKERARDEGAPWKSNGAWKHWWNKWPGFSGKAVKPGKGPHS